MSILFSPATNCPKVHPMFEPGAGSSKSQGLNFSVNVVLFNGIRTSPTSGFFEWSFPTEKRSTSFQLVRKWMDTIHWIMLSCGFWNSDFPSNGSGSNHHWIINFQVCSKLIMKTLRTNDLFKAGIYCWDPWHSLSEQHFQYCTTQQRYSTCCSKVFICCRFSKPKHLGTVSSCLCLG